MNAGFIKIEIGDESLILQNTRLNCNDFISIGDDVNIGQYVSVWTHASSMNVFDGYPFTKAPVKIGSHVWLTEGVKVLPRVTIGSHVIVGNLSLVNKDLPSGCFAAGLPVKIISENVYPKVITNDQKHSILVSAIDEYRELLKLKPFKASVSVDYLKITFNYKGIETTFDCETKKVTGSITEQAEDLRDFLRYRGIKFFTNRQFRSIPPIWYQKAIKRTENK